MKSIRLSKHALRYLDKRGFTVKEVLNAIQNSKWKQNNLGPNCFECSADYPFNNNWNGKYNKTKRVRPIFEERDLEIVVITVYTYYY